MKQLACSGSPLSKLLRPKPSMCPGLPGADSAFLYSSFYLPAQDGMTSSKHRANSRDPRAGCQRFRSQLSLNTGRAGRALTAWTGPWITCLLSLPRRPNRKKYCGRGVTRMEFLFNTSESHQLRCTNWSTWLFWNSFLYSSHISALVIPFLSAPCCCSVR